MPSLIDLRRRIRSVKNTQQITRAMKLVSAAKLRKAQDRVLAARPYSGLLREMLAVERREMYYPLASLTQLFPKFQPHRVQSADVDDRLG